MSNALQVFNFDNKDIRTVTDNGDPWFVAKDVCDALNLADTTSALRLVDEDDKQIREISGPDQIHYLQTINESGLYSLVLRSNKPEAKQFKKWLTSVVIPSIRKTGSYSANSTALVVRDPVAEIDRLAVSLNQILPSIAQSLVIVNDKMGELEGKVGTIQQKQQATDPQQMNRLRYRLHVLRDHLVKESSRRGRPITHARFWRTVNGHVGVGSFALTNQLALTVRDFDQAIDFAEDWCRRLAIPVPVGAPVVA